MYINVLFWPIIASRRFNYVQSAHLFLWPVPDEYIGDLSCEQLPLFVQKSPESIVRGGLLVVVPFFDVRSDQVFVIRLDGQERVYGLHQELDEI